MSEAGRSEKFSPIEDNLGKDCDFWWVGQIGQVGCCYPKAELAGRQSCEGIIDDVCLFVKDGRPTSSLTPIQEDYISTIIPGPDKSHLPPGSITP